MIHVVYAIIDPITSQLYYIGRTSNFERRKRQHLNNSHGFAGFHTNKLTEDGYFPLFFILEQTGTRAQSIRSEIFWIEVCRTRNVPLLNKENLEAKGPAMAGSPWSSHEDARLLSLVAQDRSISDISTIFLRTRGAIKSRLRYLEARS